MKSVKILSDMLLTPRQAAEMLGVSESTVRRWCDQDMLRASRTTGKHRRIERAALLEFARREGIAIASSVTAAGRGGRIASSDELVDRLFHALVAGDERQAQQLMIDLAIGVLQPSVFCDQIIAPVMHRIGDEWARGRLDVYREHAATDTIHTALGIARSYLTPAASTAPGAVCASLAGDPYVLGSAMSALVLQSENFRPHLIGPNTPALEVMRAAQATSASIVALSIGAVQDRSTFIADFNTLVETAERESIVVAVGGQGLDREIRRQISADFFGDTMGHLASFARRHRRTMS